MNYKIKNDILASIVVFLVALPLCLGVALASGAPMLSGIIAGIIGGIVVGALSQSQVSVSGPAAGLAAIVFSSIATLGNFESFLLAVLLSGALQLIAGLAKTGFIANYIPSNVIKGLLAAIGIILILKQIPHAVGFDRDNEGDFSFFQRDGENTFSELVNIFTYFSWGAIIISAISFITLIFWDKTPLRKVKLLPSSLFVVLLGIIINLLFIKFVPQLSIVAPEHLVQIPKFEKFADIITFPDFSSILSYKVWLVAFTLMAVASLETLLNLKAVENLDPYKRTASPDRELIAQGVGNILSGLFGGLPITSVIVRSSANITAGAETKLSTISHAILLLLSILILSPVLNMIPLASLACLLIFTGYKLAKISLFKEMYAKGQNQFIPFMVTILAIVFTDLLIGVLIGLAISIFYILKSNFKNPFVLEKNAFYADDNLRLELPNQVSFLNKASIQDLLWKVPKGSKLVIDGSHADFIDNDVMDVIEDFKTKVSKEKNIKLNVVGLKEEYQREDYVQFVNTIDKTEQQKIEASEILQMLKQGNERFLAGKGSEKYLKQQMSATSVGQNPLAIILSCIDSRTTTEHVFDLGLGDIFSVRIAGNILNEDILGSMEFGTHVVGVKLLVVLGHTKCGAIVGACNNTKLGNLTILLDKIKPAIEKETSTLENRDGSNNEFVNKVAALNVTNTIARIRKESTIIAELENAGKVKIVGGMYDVESGKVEFYEE
jgi:carbonic anhydrase